MTENKWTKSQEQAITSRDNNLLVSAGAGSGKTTVMIARIVDLIVNNHVPISNFLVVTFTKASASDMKNKLIRQLEKLSPDTFILEQIEEIGTSDVSNLHSFCARLLKTYFYYIGLDPAFVVLDEVEMSVLKEKAMAKLFEEGLQNGDKELLELADILNKNRSDIGLSEAIMTLREFLLSQIDGIKWLDNLIEKCYDKELNNNICANFLNKRCVNLFKNARNQFEDFLSIAQNLEDDKLINFLSSAVDYCAQISSNATFASNFITLMNLSALPRMPSKVSDNAQDLKDRVDGYKKWFTKQIENVKEWWGENDLEKIELHLLENKQRVLALKRLAIRFDEILTEQKNAKGGLDFSDLEKYTLKILEIDEVRHTLVEKYKYIFVDEYQDINPVQEKILTLLSNGFNRFMVGDIKQSIYRFRLCEPEIFLSKYNDYNNPQQTQGKVIDLQENFRSNSKILKFCNLIFSKIYTKDFGGIDYNPDGLLICGTEEWDNPNGFPAVDFNFLETKGLKQSLKPQEVETDLPIYSVLNHENFVEEEGSVAIAEASVIAEKISTLIGSTIYSKDGTNTKLRFKDMVVLLASRGEYLKEFVSALSAFNIPVSSDYSQDVFEDEYILALLNTLKIIDNFAQDYPLACAMHSPLFNFSLNELAIIKKANLNEKFFYQAIEHSLEAKNLQSVLQKKVEKFYQQILRWKNLSGFMGAKDLINKIINETEFELLILSSCDSQASAQKLARFMQVLTNDSLSQFIKDVESSKITCLSVPEGDAVRVMTIHSSKGLEFPVVFLANCGKKFSGKYGMGDLLISKDLGIGLRYYNSDMRYKCENFVRSAIKLNEGIKIKEEQLRLLYVALTRAINHLIIVGSGEIEQINASLNANLGNSFLDWFAMCIEDKIYGTNKFNNVATIHFYDALDEARKGKDKDYRQVIFKDPNIDLLNEIKSEANKEQDYFKFNEFSSKSSVTAINRQEITNEPVLFSEEESGESAELGTAYHKLLEKIDYNNIGINKLNEILQNLIKDNIISHDVARLINLNNILKIATNEIIVSNLDGQFFKEKEFIMSYNPLTKNCENESEFMVVQGVCDLVIMKNNKLILIDFKLSKKNAQKLKQTYNEQIELYSKALENSYNLPVYKRYICKINTGEFIEI